MHICIDPQTCLVHRSHTQCQRITWLSRKQSGGLSHSEPVGYQGVCYTLKEKKKRVINPGKGQKVGGDPGCVAHVTPLFFLGEQLSLACNGALQMEHAPFLQHFVSPQVSPDLLVPCLRACPARQLAAEEAQSSGSCLHHHPGRDFALQIPCPGSRSLE